MRLEASSFFAGKDLTMLSGEVQTGALLHKREIAALRLGVSLRTLDELIASKQIASVKIGKRRLVSETSLANFIRKRESVAKDS
jgi:excisionase family DNA binding protein